jgi:GNAT superfamily N-acetyltransferase
MAKASYAGYTFTVTDPRSFSDHEIAEGVELSNLLLAEILPDETPSAVATRIAAMRVMPTRYGLWNMRVRTAEGQLVCGTSAFKDWEHDDNPDLTGLSVDVHPDHRGRGLGSAMLAYQVAFARALGHTRFVGSTMDCQPCGDPLARSLGGSVKARSHVNRLVLADVGEALLREWTDEAVTRSEGYELLAVDGPIPDNIVDAFVDLLLVMNTAPRDDLQCNDFSLTVQEWRENEERMAAVEAECWTLIARHRATGRLVGLHDVTWFPVDPEIVNVGVTGVEPKHRGSSLGRWMKAVMTLRVLEERSGVREIRTGNADSNAAMLAINERMGYQHWLAETTWEFSREQVETWLAQRGIPIPDLRAAVDAQRPTVAPLLA